MTLMKHECRLGRNAFFIWTGAIGFFMIICIFLFPQMKEQVEGVSEVFSSMGTFTAAFGMDRLNFGTMIGFYGVECCNVLGIGGGFYAAMIGVNALAKEEKEHTAEFLLTHPVSRKRVITEKLLAVMMRIIVMNLIVFLISVVSIAAVGEDISWKELSLLHAAYLLMQIELAGICFGISAFLRRGGLGIGLGLASMMYFLNIIANISEDAEFLKYITPFGYAEAADILSDMSMDVSLVAVGVILTVVGVVAAYWKYTRKDVL